MSSDDTLETARLALRPFAGSDFEEFFRSCISDPEVMAFFHAYRDASRKVLERIGFEPNGPVEVYGSKDMLLYTAQKPWGLT